MRTLNRQQSYKSMSKITIDNLLQKIREIDKDGNIHEISSEKSTSQLNLNLECFLKSLQCIHTQIKKGKKLEQSYYMLEQALQRQEMQIRKRIGIEQQLKLYTEALKYQVEEIQKQKLELLENSKIYIKQLKKSNEKLYSQMNMNTRKKSRQMSPNKTDKQKGNSLSQKKANHNKSIRQIIKTQYIDRNHSGSGKHKKSKTKRQGFSTIAGHEANEINNNSKTMQMINPNFKKQLFPASHSKDKSKILFSNYTLLTYLDNSNIKAKNTDKNATRTPQRKKGKKDGERRKQKDKKANKSIMSIPSIGASSHKKQTI